MSARPARPDAPPPGLHVRGLTVHAGRHVLVHHADLDLAPGTCTALVGPNGAGKSSLLAALAGLRRARGTARLTPPAPAPPATAPHTPGRRPAGADLTTLAPRRRARLLAHVPQRPVLPPDLPVRDYVALGRTAHLGPFAGPGTRHEAVARALHDLDLQALAHRTLGTLSGGEAQRAVLARALAQGTDLLLLDEPTSALDLGHAQHVLELLDALRRARGLGVLMAVHDLTLAGTYADRVVLMAHGRTVAAGAPGDVVTAEALHRHYGATADVLPDGPGVLVRPRRPAPPAPRADDPADPHDLPGLLPPPAGVLRHVTLPTACGALRAVLWRDPAHRDPDAPGWATLSTSVLGGGAGHGTWWLDAQVPGEYHRTDPDRHVAGIAVQLGLDGPGVGMLTAADVRRATTARSGAAWACATVGIAVPVQAARPAPDGPAPARPAPPPPGTINVLVLVDAPLDPAAHVNLLVTATEAKSQALADLGVPGTGTASDALCVAVRTAPGSPPAGHAPGGAGGPGAGASDGPWDLAYGGPRSRHGADVARAVHRAVRDGAAGWIARHGPPAPEPDAH